MSLPVTKIHHMTPDDLLEFCLSLPQAEETFPFDEETSVFKTTGNGKVRPKTPRARSAG